ncbi:SAM hydrolase/SAM-dependent halogenase family protein [Alkalilimnicola ehrlichii]|uniref:SAM hydrolase/SAM-dependent halogenase family protein n=1 Tax=Alkalilimnicola ehrlichii TaxID=351052 RepID=UPI003B9FBC53
MFILFTDFGYEGPYVGQMKAVLYAGAPQTPVVDLMHDAPVFRPDAAGRLLAAYGRGLPGGSITLAVVDPGVGGERRALAAQADGRWWLGPDNGLLVPALHRCRDVAVWQLATPADAAPSFHGRDLFAPAALQVLKEGRVSGQALPPGELVGWDAVQPVPAILYIDRYGNAVTGLDGDGLANTAVVEAGYRAFRFARTFGCVAPGEAFWYRNSSGLVELAVNQGRADEWPGVELGAPVKVFEAHAAGQPGGEESS